MITNIFFSLYFVTDLIIDFGGSRVKNLLIERVPEITISFVPPLVCFFILHTLALEFSKLNLSRLFHGINESFLHIQTKTKYHDKK